MNQFKLEIHRCNDMLEFVEANEKPPTGSSSSNNQHDAQRTNGGESSFFGLQTTNSQNEPNRNDGLCDKEVAMTMADNHPEISDGTFESPSGSSISNEPIEYVDCDTFETSPAYSPILNYVASVSQNNTATEQSPNDNVDVSNPTIEPHDSAIDPPEQQPNRSLLHLQHDICKFEEIIQTLKDETQRQIGISNQLRSDNKVHLEKEFQMQAQLTELKKKLYQKTAECIRLRQQHDDELEKAIEDTKNKRWCVNCKKEASIKKYKQPVCSRECLLLVV